METDSVINFHPNREGKAGMAPYASFTRCNFNPVESRIGSGFWMEVSRMKKSIAETVYKAWSYVMPASSESVGKGSRQEIS